MVLKAGDAPQALADNLTEILIAAVSQLDRFEIVGKEEFQTIVGVTSEKRALNCLHDTTCLSKVGMELGLAEIVVGIVSRRGEQHMLVLDRVDVRRGEAVGHVYHEEAGGPDGLFGAVFGLAERLFSVAAAPDEPKPDEPKPDEPAAPPPAAPGVGSTPTWRIAFWGAAGTALAAGLAGALYGLRVRNAAAEIAGRCCLEDAGRRSVYDMTRADAVDRKDEVDGWVVTTNVLYGVSAAAVAAATAIWLLRPQESAPAASVGPDGVVLGFSF